MQLSSQLTQWANTFKLMHFADVFIQSNLNLIQYYSQHCQNFDFSVHAFIGNLNTWSWHFLGVLNTHTLNHNITQLVGKESHVPVLGYKTEIPGGKIYINEKRRQQTPHENIHQIWTSFLHLWESVKHASTPSSLNTQTPEWSLY